MDEVAVGEEEIVDWVRYPADVARMVVAAVVWVVVTVFAVVDDSSAERLTVEVVDLVDALPETVSSLLVGLLQVAAVVVPLTALVLARRRRWRELGQALGAAAATMVAGAITGGWFSNSVPPVVLDAADTPSWVTDASFPSGTYLAAVAAAVTVVVPSLSKPWRRVAWWSVALVALARVITAVATPAGLLAPLAVGVFVGSAVMVIFKSPLRSPRPEAIIAALARGGIVATSVVPTAERHKHGPTYLAATAEGDRFVKLVGRDERNGQWLSRAVKAVRVESPEDRWTAGAKETIEHEALMLHLAARAGASVPAVVAVGLTDERAALVVMDARPGETLDRRLSFLPPPPEPLASDGDAPDGDAPDGAEPANAEPAEAVADAPRADIDDAVVVSVFEQLAALHGARITHGWASFHHVLLGDDGTVTLLDLRWATPSATDDALAADLAEMLSSSAAYVGVERTVAAASSVFAPEALAATLPFIQPLAVTPETRKATKADKKLLERLRSSVQESAGVEAYEMAEIERLSWQKVVMLIGTLVLAVILLGLFSHASEIWDAIQGMDWAYIPLLAVISLMGYPSGALSLMGAVNVRLKLWHTTEVMFAQSFLNRFTPANAGGMALRTVYLQRSGVTLLTAASAVGLTSAASGVMQVLMAFVFFTWAGQDDTTGGFTMPSINLVALIIVVVVGGLAITWATTAGRRFLIKAWESIRSSLADFRELARHPRKMAMLFTGAGLAKLAMVLALCQTMRAFGVPVDFPLVGAVYITATTVAAAVPTPGGMGAITAALMAGLVGIGVESDTAAAIAIVFRLFTYWLPTIPSWFALRRMQRSGEL